MTWMESGGNLIRDLSTTGLMASGLAAFFFFFFCGGGEGRGST